MPGQAACQQRFSRAKWAGEEQVVAACGSNLERALCAFLPLHLPQVRAADRLLCDAGLWIRQALRSLQMDQQADEVGGRHDRDAAGPAGLCSLRLRADQPLLHRTGVKRRQQHAGGGHDPAVQRHFSHRDELAQLLCIRGTHGCQKRQRDRKVIVRSFFRKVSRGEVDGDPLGWKRQAHGGERCLNALSALADRLVRQAHDGKAGQAGCELALNLHAARLQPEIGHR